MSRLVGPPKNVSEGTNLVTGKPSDRHPLSFNQERVWLLDQIEDLGASYNIAYAFHLKGRLDEEALERALQVISSRHEPLRTTFHLYDEGPVQVIRDDLIFKLEDIGFVPEGNGALADNIKRILSKEASRQFRMSEDLMLRAGLLRISDKENYLLLCMHHIATDGWSIGPLFQEISLFYSAYTRGEHPDCPDLPKRYVDYALWQRSHMVQEKIDNLLSFWKQFLSDCPTSIQLPLDHPRGQKQTFRGAREKFEIPKGLLDRIKVLGRSERSTPFMTLLSLFGVLLFRYTGQQRILLGSPIANRTKSDWDKLIGFFVNTLVYRSNFAEDPTFREFLSRMRTDILNVWSHQDIPFEKLVEGFPEKRDLSLSPLFQVMFILHNTPSYKLSLHGLEAIEFELDHTGAAFDLTMSLAEIDGNLSGWLEYNSDLFERSTIQRMLGHYRTLMESAACNPEIKISKLPMLTEAESRNLLVDLNDTHTDYPIDVCFHQLFEEQVGRTPDATAVVFEKEHLTYKDLNDRANQVANYLRREGVRPGNVTAIYMERSLEMVVALVGILKAGATYLPLDPIYPPDRVAFMLEDSEAGVILTQQELADHICRDKAKIICVDTDEPKIAKESEENLALDGRPGDLAYLIYTSGSTGKPKGVGVPHDALSNFLQSMVIEPGITEQDSFLSVTTLSFDIAVLEIFGPLIVGARVVIASREVASDGRLLAESIENYGITILQATPTMWSLLLHVGWSPPKKLKVLCGGEAMTRDMANSLVKNGASVWNMYGPTETTVWSAIWKVEPGDVPISIGRPIGNTEIYILNTNFEVVPTGIPGELHIGGSGLAKGYHNRPELTAEKFIPNPFSQDPNARLYKTGDLAKYMPDGNIECLGRIDHQVKIRGFRLELGEIEALLRQNTTVKEAVVVAREDRSGDKRLVAYIIPIQQTVEPNELRAFLTEKLPNYMVPSAIMILDDFPQTPNGKVDRKAFPAPENSRPDLTSEYLGPRNDIEQKICEVWKDILGLDRIGIHDTFFELGGHSLSLVRMVAQLENSFAMKVPVVEAFRRPTIEALATFLTKSNGAENSLAEIRSNVDRQKKSLVRRRRLGSRRGGK